VAAVGSALVAGMSLVTLSFLITTPECWVPALGSPEHGFPLLSGAGRLVVKDAMMMGAALVTMAATDQAPSGALLAQHLVLGIDEDHGGVGATEVHHDDLLYRL